MTDISEWVEARLAVAETVDPDERDAKSKLREAVRMEMERRQSASPGAAKPEIRSPSSARSRPTQK